MGITVGQRLKCLLIPAAPVTLETFSYLIFFRLQEELVNSVDIGENLTSVYATLVSQRNVPFINRLRNECILLP